MKTSKHQSQSYQSSKEAPMDSFPAPHGSWANAWCMDQQSQPTKGGNADDVNRTGRSSEDDHQEK